MKKLLTTIVLFFTFITANADLPDAPRFSWTPPTEYTNGQPLDPVTDLQGYPLTCTGASTVTHTTPAPATEWQSAVGDFIPGGTYDCSMTALDKSGVESAPSVTVNFTMPALQPNPTTGLTVQ